MPLVKLKAVSELLHASASASMNVEVDTGKLDGVSFILEDIAKEWEALIKRAGSVPERV